MLESIFVDIDGVSNQFHRHVFNRLGLPLTRDADYPVQCGWDIVAAANHLAGYERFTPGSFWRSITREMWATAPVSEEFDFIITWAASKAGKEHVCFLTSPTLDPDSVAGKLEWIQRYAPVWMQRQYLIGPAKHLCAKPNVLLIDDSNKKVATFRRHGGLAVLVPRPWNSLHGLNAMTYLKDQFGRF